MTALDRVVFDTPRAAEFLERRALQAQTGQQADQFGDVVVKELCDNALDAAESAGAEPDITIVSDTRDGFASVEVLDNGPGIPGGVVERILDFDVLVSDKAAYRSPTRGMQGNAWKTLLGIPYALDVDLPVTVEAQGLRHELAVAVDPGGNVVATHDTTEIPTVAGTRVVVPLPLDLIVEVERWARAFSLVNPHAAVRYQDKNASEDGLVSYKPTVGDGWRKPIPTDKTSPHWYDGTALKRLVYAYIGAARRGGPDVPLGEFVRSFAGLSSTAKAKAVAAAVEGVERLSDFQQDPDRIVVLLEAMKAEAKAPKPATLGSVGEDHLRARFDEWFGVERFWYRRKRLDHSGMPWVLEVAVAETKEPGEVFYAANYSPTFADPLGDTFLDGGEVSTTGAESFLRRCDAYPAPDNQGLRAAVVHVICPGLEFTDKGKTRLGVPRGDR